MVTSRTRKEPCADACRARRASLGPRWRNKRARELLDGGRREPIDDQLVREAQQFHARAQVDAAAAEEAFPTIAQAVRLLDDEALLAVLKVATIGGLGTDEIAARTGQQAEVVEMWQKLFFDIFDFRNATDWLVLHVVQPEYDAGRTQVGAKLKLAMAGGPIAVRAILDEPSGALIDDALRWWRHGEQLFGMVEQALDMVLADSATAMKFLSRQADIMLAERRLNLEHDKLLEKCREGLRRHEQTMVRLRAAEAREQRRLLHAQRMQSAGISGSSAATGATSGERRDAATADSIPPASHAA